MYHGDVPDDIGQALVQQREDDNVQRGPLGLETEPEAKPLAGPGGPPEVGGGGTAWAAGSSVSLLGLGAVKLLSRHRGGTHRVPSTGMETKAASLKQEEALSEQPLSSWAVGGRGVHGKRDTRELQNQA